MPEQGAPRLGAWIETGPTKRALRSHQSHHLVQVRGLKQPRDTEQLRAYLSHPKWARGFETATAGWTAVMVWVAPCAGAWIELAFHETQDSLALGGTLCG